MGSTIGFGIGDRSQMRAWNRNISTTVSAWGIPVVSASGHLRVVAASADVTRGIRGPRHRVNRLTSPTHNHQIVNIDSGMVSGFDVDTLLWPLRMTTGSRGARMSRMMTSLRSIMKVAK